IDEKFLVREVSRQSEVGELDSNAVVYGLYRIQVPDINRLMLMKDRALNCVAQQVIEHFDQTKRGHGLTETRWQKIDIWEKRCAFLNDTWKAINNALQGPQAIWLIGVEDRNQTISQFVLDDGIISEKRKRESLESLKVVDLAEQQSCVEHGHGGRWNAPDYCVQDVFERFGHPTHHLVRVAVNGELPKDDITGFAKHFACQNEERCGKAKGWTPIVLLRYLLEAGILESVTIGEAIISLTKQTKDCIKEGTYASREKYPLGFILTYYEGHQPQYTYLRASMLAYAYINLLEMLQRFDPNEVVRIATDSIYVRKDALYKIKNIPAFFKQVEVKSDPNLCSHYPSCAMSKYNCKRHKPFICRFCFGEWFYSGASAKTYRSDSYALLHQPEEQEIQEIQPDIPDSIAPTIHEPITRCRNSYLNGGGGSGKTTRAIRIFKNISMIVFTRTNALAKDFREKQEWTPERMGEKKFLRVVIWDEIICCGDDAQPLPFFGEIPHNWLKEHADYYEEVLTDYWAKCPKLRELKKEMRCKNNQSSSDQILLAHRLSQRLASQICLKLHCTKYSEILILLIYRPKDGRKQNCLVPISSSSEKRKLVKNDIIHLPLNTLSDKFLQGMLGKEKAIDWELGYAMTIHTIGHIEYLGQLIRIEGPPLPPEIKDTKNKKAIERSLRLFISGKLVEYMNQDKKKDREFNLSVDYILVLKDSQKNKCKLCLNELLWD
ncbi:1196_t:CDS:10, partial [Racocetra persica]